MQNIYDFDDTIYIGDSTRDFIFYCLKKYPKTWLSLFSTGWAFLLFMLGINSKTKFKETMYRFLLYIPDPEKAVDDFWLLHRDNIYPYYRETQKENDIVISASPEFLVKPCCGYLGIKTVMASRVDIKTGKYDGENCHGKEKVKRLYQAFPNIKCDNFYSDSLSDTPLAEISDKAYIIKKGDVLPWQSHADDKVLKLKKMFLSQEFFMFLVIGVINTINGIWMSWAYSCLIPSVNVAFVVGYISSMVVSYILNSILTFKEKLSFGRYIKFFISYMPNFIIQNVMVMIFYNILGWNKLLVFAIAAVIGVPVTFLFMKVFAFSKKKK